MTTDHEEQQQWAGEEDLDRSPFPLFERISVSTKQQQLEYMQMEMIKNIEKMSKNNSKNAHYQTIENISKNYDNDQLNHAPGQLNPTNAIDNPRLFAPSQQSDGFSRKRD